MLRWRSRAFPPLPRKLRDFGEALERIHDGGILEYSHGRMRSRMIVDANGDVHVLLYDSEFLRVDLHDATSLLVDATFDSVPALENGMKLMTILLIKFNHVSSVHLYHLKSFKILITYDYFTFIEFLNI